MDVCTIIAKNYLAHARVLVKSFRQHHPEGRFFVLVIDDFEGYIEPVSEDFEIVVPRQIGLPDYDLMTSGYDVLELSTAVKPWLLRYLMEQLGCEAITYLDPDIVVFDSLEGVDSAAREHGLVLTPHTTEPLPNDSKQPTELGLMASGTYNLGFVAMSMRDEIASLLDWWSERLEWDCVVDHRSGFFVDQRWIDLAPGFVSDVCVLREPGYNVAYWNLSNRWLDKGPRGRYLVNGEPLRFFHFSGFNPAYPHVMSKHQTRFKIDQNPVLTELYEDYAKALEGEGYEDCQGWPYTYEKGASGGDLPPVLRGLFRAGARSGQLKQGLFTREGEREFFSWLTEPVGKNKYFNRLLAEIYRDRPDLQSAYPRAHGADAEGLAGWAHVHGVNELGLPKRALPPAPSHIVAADEEPTDGSGAGASSESDEREKPPPKAALEPWGVNVVGYLRSELGVGEAARLAITALDAARISSMPVHGKMVPNSRQSHDYAHVTPSSAPYPVNLICVNADGLPGFVEEAGTDFFEGRYQVGMWWWEVLKFPERWRASFDYLDEVWVGSQHIQDALTPVSPIPVFRFTVPITVPPIRPRSRAQLGLPEGFVFLFLFDFHSVLERKNPLGLIEAFRKAFDPGGGASLVIKCINGEYHPDKRALLDAATGGHPDIHIVDRYVSKDDKNAMIASADCYVSLHRSEGLGLTPAEAMYLGKPVIATKYSGNLDFMTESNSYLVDWQRVPIGDDCFPYPSDGWWADPDTDQAAGLMREVFDNQEAAAQRGRVAAADIRRTHSPEAAGEVMRERLDWIRERMAEGRGKRAWRPRRFAVASSRGSLQERIAAGPVDAAGGGGPLARMRRFMKRAMLRVLRPYSYHQRELLLDMSARVERDIPAAQAELLERMRAIIADNAELSARLDVLETRTRARPDERFLPFEDFPVPGVGTVYGYRELGDGASGDREAYREFEEMFRGPEELIRQRQKRYLDVIGPDGPVLDVGCGRGEFLDLLRERGVRYTGIDSDSGMVDRCRERGHESVVVSDANAYLDQLPDRSLGAVFSAQVIEHMPVEYLEHFFRLAERKLKPGGMLICETVNPHSVEALKAFWLDLTHEQPIFPEVALAQARIAGFGSAYVFHPNGTGSVEADRFEQGDYALVATTAGLALDADTLGAERQSKVAAS